jgi:hypothetical protein
MKKRRPKHLDFPRARTLLFQPGHVLQEIKSSRGRDFVIVPGGPVTETVARRLLDHPLCQPVDRGLLPECPQTWSFARNNNKRETPAG